MDGELEHSTNFHRHTSRAKIHTHSEFAWTMSFFSWPCNSADIRRKSEKKSDAEEKRKQYTAKRMRSQAQNEIDWHVRTWMNYFDFVWECVSVLWTSNTSVRTAISCSNSAHMPCDSRRKYICSMTFSSRTHTLSPRLFVWAEQKRTNVRLSSVYNTVSADDDTQGDLLRHDYRVRMWYATYVDLGWMYCAEIAPRNVIEINNDFGFYFYTVQFKCSALVDSLISSVKS